MVLAVGHFVISLMSWDYPKRTTPLIEEPPYVQHDCGYIIFLKIIIVSYDECMNNIDLVTKTVLKSVLVTMVLEHTVTGL